MYFKIFLVKLSLCSKQLKSINRGIHDYVFPCIINMNLAVIFQYSILSIVLVDMKETVYKLQLWTQQFTIIILKGKNQFDNFTQWSWFDCDNFIHTLGTFKTLHVGKLKCVCLCVSCKSHSVPVNRNDQWANDVISFNQSFNDWSIDWFLPKSY